MLFEQFLVFCFCCLCVFGRFLQAGEVEGPLVHPALGLPSLETPPTGRERSPGESFFFSFFFADSGLDYFSRIV